MSLLPLVQCCMLYNTWAVVWVCGHVPWYTHSYWIWRQPSRVWRVSMTLWGSSWMRWGRQDWRLRSWGSEESWRRLRLPWPLLRMISRPISRTSATLRYTLCCVTQNWIWRYVCNCMMYLYIHVSGCVNREWMSDVVLALKTANTVFQTALVGWHISTVMFLFTCTYIYCCFLWARHIFPHFIFHAYKELGWPPRLVFFYYYITVYNLSQAFYVSDLYVKPFILWSVCFVCSNCCGRYRVWHWTCRQSSSGEETLFPTTSTRRGVCPPQPANSCLL